MIRIFTIISLLLFFGISACKPHYKIPEGDFSLLPYSGNEVWGFSSNTGTYDSIRLDGFSMREEIITSNSKNYFSDQRILMFKPNKNFDSTLIGHYNIFAMLSAHPDGTYFTALGLWQPTPFFATVKEDWFFRKEKLIQLKLKTEILKDVLILVTTDTASVKPDKPRIQQLYWSKSAGLVGYDFSDGEQWRLEFKHP
jgi:hypothetical protein